MKNKQNNLTEIVFIIDRSGSMGGLESDTIGGYNSFLERQKKEGTAVVSTVLFSNDSFVLHDRVPLEKVEPMTEADYITGGCTALLDATGDAVKHIRNVHKYARKEDVPAHTIFVIITDGMENASRRYSYSAVKKLIGQCTENGWEFLFLGANMDAVEAAAKVGIQEDRAVRYRSDSAGTRLNYESVGNAVRMMCMSAGRINGDWKADIEEDYKNRS